VRGSGLRQKIALSLVAIVIVALGANVIWNVNAQEQRMTTELIEKATILNEEMMSVWDFISDNQDLINYDSQGNYEFKRLQCSLVGMSIGNIFNRRTDYIIKYTSPDPRNPLNRADEHEAAAFEAFKLDESLTQYYGFAKYNGNDTFRYIAPMRVEESCLECHGGLPGEVDVLGYEMEGFKEGEVYGTVSITMPVKAFRDNMKFYILEEVFLSALILLSCIGVIYFLLTRWVTRPLKKLQDAAGEIAQGNWDTQLEGFGSTGEIRDLSADFSHMAEQLKSAYNDLENQVENRTEALRTANLLLEQQSIELHSINQLLIEDNHFKSDFLSIVSHELRTPLTSIIAFVAQLQKSEELRSPRTDRLLRELNTSSHILLGKINNVLETARLDAGRAEFIVETVDIGDVVAAVEDMMRPVAENKGVGLFIQIDSFVPLFEADQDKLRSIIENLVGNALKFTDEGDSVTVRVDYLEERKLIQIVVKDSGVGISKEDQQAVFEPFERGNSSTPQKYGGTGLGLSLVKKYTEMHGGTITLVSEPGEGSVFSVLLPEVSSEEA
jgi:signal transduction histidine kinase